MGIDHGRAHILMAQQFLDGPDVVAVLKEVGRKRMAVRISILPMKCPLSRFIIVTIRFMENTARSFAGYGDTRAIKSLLSSVMKSR